MGSLYALVLGVFDPINGYIYRFMMLVYHIYISFPHLPLVRNIIELWRPYLQESYKQQNPSIKELRTIENSPKTIATSLSLTKGGPLEKQITCLCEDATQILVWAAQTRPVEKLIIFDKSCLLSINGQELHHTIAAALDKLPSALQRNLSTRYASQSGIIMDLDVIFTDPNDFRPEPVDLFISFDGMFHGYPLVGLSNAIIFTPYRRCRASHRPQLSEYTSALEVYEQAMQGNSSLPATF